VQKRKSLLWAAERVGQGRGGWGHPQGDIHLVAPVKGPWLGPGGPPPTLTAWTGLENSVGGWSGKEGYLGSEQVYDN